MKITRRDFVQKTATGLATSSVYSPQLFSIVTSKTQKKPNILFIFTDQQHIDTISALGCPYLKTPGMDEIAERGVSFEQSYCPSPVCGPCRAAVYTGRMPSEVGVTGNGERPVDGIPFMGEWFREKGDYETVYMGKWHVPAYVSSRVPGFEVPFCGHGGPGALSDSSYTFAAEAFFKNYSSGQKPFLMAINYMQPHDICEWLRFNRKGKTHLPFTQIHGELPPLPDNFEIPENEPELVRLRRLEWEGVNTGWSDDDWRYYIWAYYRHVEMVDAEIKRVLDALNSSAHKNNTAIVFSSDHGEGLGHHKMVRKAFHYDEASKVPLIFSWPGHYPEALVNNQDLVSGVDIFPTMCDIAGIVQPNDMTGQSLGCLLSNNRSLEREFVTSEIEENRGQMLRTQRYKYITYYEDPVEQLFDMIKDPGEKQNLAEDSQYLSILSEHRTLFKDWIRSLKVPPVVKHRW